MFGKSRQGYYDTLRRKSRHRVNSTLVVHHVQERRQIQPKEGVRKLYHNLQPVLEAEGVKMGRDALFRLLKAENMLVRKTKRGTRTTNSEHPFFKYPNLIRELQVSRPEQVWASDITYISSGEGFLYLSLITDLYSHKIVGHKLHKTLKTDGPLAALQEAMRERTYPYEPLIHHSDKGIQYCSHIYTNTLKNGKIAISMAEAGNPYENAVAERVNGILKDEFNLDCLQKLGFNQVEKIISEAVWVYNQFRSHGSCDYMTPAQAHTCNGFLAKRWKQKVY